MLINIRLLILFIQVRLLENTAQRLKQSLYFDKTEECRAVGRGSNPGIRDP